LMELFAAAAMNRNYNKKKIIVESARDSKGRVRVVLRFAKPCK
jgi:hypothetical protein